MDSIWPAVSLPLHSYILHAGHTIIEHVCKPRMQKL